jgi:hypothetical protein
MRGSLPWGILEVRTACQFGYVRECAGRISCLEVLDGLLFKESLSLCASSSEGPVSARIGGWASSSITNHSHWDPLLLHGGAPSTMFFLRSYLVMG